MQDNHHGGLTHFDEGGQAHMVDVGAKGETHRVAIASGIISMKPSTLGVVMDGTAKKGMCLGLPASPRSWPQSVPAI